MSSGILPAEPLPDLARYVLEAARLVMVKTRLFNVLFQPRHGCVDIVLRLLILFEEALSHAVDALVGALGGEDGSHGQLKGVRPVKLYAGFAVHGFQLLHNGVNLFCHFSPR